MIISHGDPLLSNIKFKSKHHHSNQTDQILRGETKLHTNDIKEKWQLMNELEERL